MGLVRPRITDLDRAALEALAVEEGQPAYRGRQVWRHVIERGLTDPAQMTDLPPVFRETLARRLATRPPGLAWQRDSGTTTEKAVLTFDDGRMVESVLIMEGDRTTACLSSQSGCPVACRFCASGLLGLDRNLTSGEILDQFLALRARAAELGRRLGNVVMMGMGEPLLNIGAVLQALRVLNEDAGIGARHITVSTVGLHKGIDRLRAEGKQYTLAFSLHAPDDETRRDLIPFPGAMTVEEIVRAAREHMEQTGREVTFEYVLLAGVNASPEHARCLSRLIAGVRGTVNLIPYNANPGMPFARPGSRDVDIFAEILRAAGIKVSVRKQKGDPILAACGQLRLRAKGDP